MITIRNLKLKEYQEENIITLNELKEILLRHYYGKVYKTKPDLFKLDMGRELVITKVNGAYGRGSSVVFSVNGSPPKGEAILFLNSEKENYYCGSLIVMGNGKISSKIDSVKIKYKEESEDGEITKRDS